VTTALSAPKFRKTNIREMFGNRAYECELEGTHTRKVCISLSRPACTEPCPMYAGCGCADAAADTPLLLGAERLTSAFALWRRLCGKPGATGESALMDAFTVRALRAGLSPSATSIMVHTPTAVSMTAGNSHAQAGGVPI